MERILASAKGAGSEIRDTATGDGPLLILLRGSSHNKIHHEIVSRLVKDGFDSDERNHRGETPLHRAVRQIRNADISILQALVTAGADIHARDCRGRTPLHYASLGGTTVVEFLVSCGADLQGQDRAGATWLMSHILHHGSLKLADLEVAVALGASIHARDNGGRTILHNSTSAAGWQFQEDIFRTPVRYGVSPEAVDFRGNTLLHVAMSKFDLNAREIDILLSWGLNMSSRNVDGRTPLHCLCARTCVQQNGWEEAIAIVFDKADDLDVQDLQGITPLHLACTCSQVLVGRLLRAGADASILTYQGLTCLHLAALCRQANILGTLLEHLKKVMPSRFAELVDARDSMGRTPLHHACRSGRVESVTVLLAEGTDITARDCKDRLPLWTCSEYDEEQKLWEDMTNAADCELHDQYDLGFPYEDEEYITSATRGLTLEDCGRPVCLHYTQRSSPEIGTGIAVRYEEDTARLGGIFDAIQDRATQLGLTASDLGAPSGIELSRFGPESIVLRSFLAMRWSRWWGTVGTAYSESFYLWPLVTIIDEGDTSMRTALRNCAGAHAWRYFTMLLRQRQLSLVDFLIESYLQVLTWVDPARETSNLHLLVSLGFSEVLRNVADQVADAVKHNHRGSELHDPSMPSVSRDKPLLFTAVQRELPNIDVLRFLVEAAQVDINEVYDYMPDLDAHGYYTYKDGEEDIQDAPTILHYLSRGKHWWHAGHCLPYLLKHPGIDLEARNKYGQTPLLLALAYNNTHSETCAQKLIESGANVMAVDNHGKTCLALAEGRTELVRVLQARGAG